MQRLALPLLVIASLLVPTGIAAAQAHPVVLSDLTVEDRDPPDYLMRRMQDETVGVMAGLTGCYVQRLGARADLAGDWRLRLWVSAQQVIRVTPEGGSFEDADLLGCVKQELLRFRLPSDAPRGGATVRFRLQFSAPTSGQTFACTGSNCALVACGALEQVCCPGSSCTSGSECREALCRAPLPPPPPPARVALSRVRGALTTEQLAAAFSPAVFAGCVTGPVGNATFSVSVSRTGRVRATRVAGTLRDRDARTCLRDAIVGITLPSGTRTSTARVDVALDALP